MKLFITSILMFFVFKISAKEFTYKSTGTLERNEVTTFPRGENLFHLSIPEDLKQI